MIVICEQCQARYLLASLLLGVSGRKVKCGVCGYVWFQPAGDEGGGAGRDPDHPESEILDPIPEGVRPIPDGSAVPALNDSGGRFAFIRNLKSKITREDFGGAVAAVAVFLLIFGILTAFHAPLVRAWPAFDLVFGAVGIQTPIPGEGLVFSDVAARAKQGPDGKYVLTLTGNILNINKTDADIPAMVAALKKPGGLDSGLSFTVAAKTAAVGPAGSVPFVATYENLPDDVTDVTIGFTGR